MNTLVEHKLIDSLAKQRNDFINANHNSIMSLKEAIEISDNIESSIPRDNSSYIDCFDTVFLDITKNIGGSAKDKGFRVNGLESSLKSMSSTDIKEQITKAVDANMWQTLFNRLGFYRHMSEKQKKDFNKTCKQEPLDFTVKNIKTTLKSMFENHDNHLLSGLLDTFSSLNATQYVSNSGTKFNKKVIIENAFIEYGDTFKLQTHGPLSVLLEGIWRWILVNRWEISTKGVKLNNIWENVSEALDKANQCYDEIQSIYAYGIEFRFFKKKTVHIILPDSIIYLLNEQLAKSNALPKAS